MNRSLRYCTLFVVCSLMGLAGVPTTTGDELRIAVASNFAPTLSELGKRFEERTGHRVVPVVGSSGKHYAQIKHGAPVEAFFSADAQRPARLEQEGLALPGSRFTYAVGRLVLWSPLTDAVDPKGEVLNQGGFRHLALANPRLAPYGQAAKEVLERRNLWQTLQGRMVRGENIGQTFQFVKSGNAELGFVAWAQLKPSLAASGGSWWMIPRTLYSPIEQQAVLLKDHPPAHDFLAFVRSEPALDIIRTHGYDLP